MMQQDALLLGNLTSPWAVDRRFLTDGLVDAADRNASNDGGVDWLEWLGPGSIDTGGTNLAEGRHTMVKYPEQAAQPEFMHEPIGDGSAAVLVLLIALVYLVLAVQQLTG